MGWLSSTLFWRKSQRQKVQTLKKSRGSHFWVEFEAHYILIWHWCLFVKALQVVMGPCQIIFWPELGWVNFLWLGSGRVSHLCFGFEFGKFPLKMSNFQFFSFSSKKIPSGRKVPGSKAGRPLIYCGSKLKVRSGRVRAHL